MENLTMEYASGLIKLKTGTEEKIEEWRSTIASRLDEAAATLQDEDVQIESWFRVEIKGNGVGERGRGERGRVLISD